MWKFLCKNSSGEDILELACGTGRVSIPLIKEGFNLTGVELSKSFCDYISAKALNYGINNRNFIHGDMSAFNLSKKFDTIIIAYNSFLHLLTNEQAEACLRCAKKHLKPAGKFYIDIYMPSPLHYYRPKNLRYPTIEYFDSQMKEEVTIEETNNYDPDNEINQLTWYYSSNSKKDFLISKFSTRMYWPDTMNRMLIEAGFKILHLWGDYDLNPFGEESTLQIYELGI
tara:strand:+ start:6585 stop:7265 length:681 start_codon:yes stop_codon:yes gene_type:complete